jgi:hypothetical protein
LLLQTLAGLPDYFYRARPTFPFRKLTDPIVDSPGADGVFVGMLRNSDI